MAGDPYCGEMYIPKGSGVNCCFTDSSFRSLRPMDDYLQ